MFFTSDMLDLEEAIDPARLSSTSPSSDSTEIPRREAAFEVESTDTLSVLDEATEAVGVLIGSRLLPTEDSFRNCSRNDIWLLGRSPITITKERKVHFGTVETIFNISNGCYDMSYCLKGRYYLDTNCI